MTESANVPADFAGRRRFDFVSLIKAIETSCNLRMIVLTRSSAPRTVLMSKILENLIGVLLLGIGHRFIERIERHPEIFQPIKMRLGKFLVVL
jgi:hypothetical protein